MTDSLWEPLAELELNLSGKENSQIYCLCSRAFIRSKTKAECWTPLTKEESENSEIHHHSKSKIYGCLSQSQDFGKQEAEVLSCYCSACSASHYSTDDHESIIISASDHQPCPEDQDLQCPLQNSDSGADLSEYFGEKTCQVLESDQTACSYSKSKLESAWEKYWSENGENIIWKSWIEKYGAYINPSYLEQNSLSENFDQEDNDAINEENIENNLGSALSVSRNDIVKENIEFSQEVNIAKYSSDKVPSLKVSNCSSYGSLSEIQDTLKSQFCIDESDTDEKILKSSSFGSYASYEKVKGDNFECDRFKNSDNERVRSRCSNTSLSVKSIANTTVTTDSMTNVTKITLSSLDLSCECESVKSGSLLSSSGDDGSRSPSASSSTSSKEEICTEADMWWKKLWKEHYEDQYASFYQLFKENFSHDNDVELSDPISTLPLVNEKLIKKAHEETEFFSKSNDSDSYSTTNSIACILKKMDKASLKSTLDDRNTFSECGENIDERTESRKTSGIKVCLKRHLENSDDSCEDLEDVEHAWRKENTLKKGCEIEKEAKASRKLDNVKQAMSLMGFSFRADPEQMRSGYVKYRKKNIRGQNRRLKLCDAVPRTHLFFDDDGNPLEKKRKETTKALRHRDNCDEDEDDDDDDDDEGEVALAKSDRSLVELESLGYEAHSSSVDDIDDVADENKKQKKKKKKQKKYVLPEEILQNKNLLKYWLRRYELFSKFDKGIKLDTESWFSVTPEKLARHHAERCRCDVIIDAFCGAGGNSIQFAFTCERVIAIDIDPLKIEIARHNAKIYGVEDRIEFVVGNFVELATRLQADVVFLSPPWGGPDYLNHDLFNLDNILPPLGGKHLFTIASNIVDNVAYFLPKNANTTDLALLCGPGGEVEIEQNFINRRLRSVTAYFGGLVMNPDEPYLENNQ